MKTAERKARVANLQTFIIEGRLIRNEFTSEDDLGRETACLLAAMSSEVARSENPDKCPADLMPNWMAHLTPWMDDAGTLDRWREVINKYAELAARWHVLNAEQWQSLRLEIRNRCLQIAEGSDSCHKNVLELGREVLAELGNRRDIGADTLSHQNRLSRWAREARRLWDCHVAVEFIAELAKGGDINHGLFLPSTAGLIAGQSNYNNAWKQQASDELIFMIFELLESRIKLAEGAV